MKQSTAQQGNLHYPLVANSCNPCYWFQRVFFQKQGVIGQQLLGVSNLFMQILDDWLNFIIIFVVKMSSQGSVSPISLHLGGEREESTVKKQSGYIPGEKSGKWSEEQHMKYIVFIDYNKQKMRSKQKRRSNKFYEEMARFITSRNALQCRSHHQKLQEKYTHVNKIINLFKHHYSKAHYRQAMDHLDAIANDKTSDLSARDHPSEISMVDAQVQTDIQDITLEFVRVEPNLVVIQGRNEQPYYPHYLPPHIYYPPTHYQPNQFPSHTTLSPQYHPQQFSWLGGFSPSRF